jgi:hypothetical protein
MYAAMEPVSSAKVMVAGRSSNLDANPSASTCRCTHTCMYWYVPVLIYMYLSTYWPLILSTRRHPLAHVRAAVFAVSRNAFTSSSPTTKRTWVLYATIQISKPLFYDFKHG